MTKMLPETTRTYRHPMFGKVTSCMADDGLEYFDMKTTCRLFGISKDQALDLFTDARNPQLSLRDMAVPGEEREGVITVPPSIIRKAIKDRLKRHNRNIAKKKRSAVKKQR